MFHYLRRTTLVHGVPVAETEFGRDPVWPVSRSDVAAYTAAVEVGRVMIPDTLAAADLDRVATGIVADRTRWVAVGSGALARAVARQLAAGSHRPLPMRPGADVAAGVLFVSGSAHPANGEQAARLVARLGRRLRELQVAEPRTATRDAVADLRAAGAALLGVEPIRLGSSVVLRAVVNAVTEIIMTTGVRRIFVTGGETAFALCRALRVTGLAYAAEIEPGLAIARGAFAGGDLWLAVKPGGFGDADTWWRAWRWFVNAE